MVQKLTENILKEVIVRRPDESQKGDFGHVLLIGGNNQLGGAILMAAQATVSSGAGLTTVATDLVNRTPLHSRTPEAMFIDWTDQSQLDAAIHKSDVILIGPGMGTNQFAVALVEHVLDLVNQEQILIVDGSALTIVAKENLVFPRDTFTVVTPHQMEWERLSKIKIGYQHEVQMNEVQRQILNIDVLVLKQHHTVIYSSAGQYQLEIGGAYQATGGMGDTLAGIIAAFVGQFKGNPIKSVMAAVYAHSAVAEQMAQYSYVVKPSFIADGMGNFMAQVQSNL